MTDAAATALSQGLWLSFYGDDFTGSTDVMDAFTQAGVPTVLFLREPQPQDMARFAHVRCVGLAGQSRGKDPQWMQAHLPGLFRALQQLNAPILQYKVCSTFDSAPHVGSIGQALDLGIPLFASRWSPMVVGAPRLRRYQMFGHLFAGAADGVHRIDRHPTMSRHPVTPMAESDLRLHLAAQTPRRIGLVNIEDMQRGESQLKADALMGDDQPVVMIDVLDEATQIEAGRLVWESRGAGLFSASSSGLQYALVAYWKQQGWLKQAAAMPSASAVRQIAVVSGSCSPMSGAQIEWAASHGFETLRMDIAAVLDASRVETEIQRLLQACVLAHEAGQSPLVYSAQGPDDPAVTGFATQAASAGLTGPEAAARVGQALAEVMRRLLDALPLQRVVVAGGDSSGAVASHLGIDALTVVAPLVPGAPLCRAWSANPRRDGLEIVLKGGQMGSAHFYGQVREGHV
jgi:uncharacterized protein YgbK (DUF1537 family)